MCPGEFIFEGYIIINQQYMYFGTAVINNNGDVFGSIYWFDIFLYYIFHYFSYFSAGYSFVSH